MTDVFDTPTNYWRNDDPGRDASEVKTYDYNNHMLIWREEDSIKPVNNFEFPEEDLETQIEEYIDKYED